MLDYCAWCNKHINSFNFQKIAQKPDNKNIKRNKFWFCCPRCLLEFNRLYQGDNFNMRFDIPRALKIGKW